MLKIVPSQSNQRRHKKLSHSGIKSKYIKHVKKEGRYTCTLCEKDYTYSFKLKQHQINHHRRDEFEKHNVDLEQLLHVSKKCMKQKDPLKSLRIQLEEEKKQQ